MRRKINNPYLLTARYYNPTQDSNIKIINRLNSFENRAKFKCFGMIFTDGNNKFPEGLKEKIITTLPLRIIIIIIIIVIHRRTP
jgi:hypothetical protein